VQGEAAVKRAIGGVLLAGAIAAGAYWYWWHWDDQPAVWPVTQPACDGFDFPVGAPDAVGYYDAQPFGVTRHLGSDWNGKGGGNTDLGDPVYAAANGIVVDARDIAGDWGNVVRVVGCGVEAIYAHLERMDVKTGESIKRGQQLGTIGFGARSNPSHLHFELRDRPLPLGGGYADEPPPGYLDPTVHIRAYRPSQQR
jgi:murein DD-endopeptidase MepM/ murein hydrolase activator NlpD